MTAHSTSWTLLVASHAFAASVALPLGGFQVFRRPPGDGVHRRAGRVWVVLMLYVAFTSFWIRELRDGAFSLLHVLSVVTIVSVIAGVVAVRTGRIGPHRRSMRGAWFGLLGAFAGAVAVPARRIPTFVLSDPAGAAAALAAVVACTAVVLLLARLTDRSVAPAPLPARVP